MKIRHLSYLTCAGAAFVTTPAAAQTAPPAPAGAATTSPAAPSEAATQDAAPGSQATPGPDPVDATPQDGGRLGDIVVTAQRREESLQRVPVTVSAFSGDQLTARGAAKISDLAALTPGLQVGSGNGSVQPFLRGVGNSATAVGNESSVAVYIDGVYYTNLAAGFFSLASIERVEVLKGPQGTLFGRNASGGVVQLVTRDPSQTTDVRGTLTYGNYDTVEGSFYATTGLGENLAIDLAVNGRWQSDGYGRNITTGERYSYDDNATIRSKLLWEPSDRTRFVLSGFYGYSKASVQAHTFEGTTQGYSSEPFGLIPRVGFYDDQRDLDSFTRFEQKGVTLSIGQELSFAQLTSTTAYIDVDSYAVYDGDYSPRPDFAVFQPAGIKQFTQELQLASLGAGPFKWQAGLFYYRTRQSYDDVEFAAGPVFGPGLISTGRQLAKSYAAYGQATYQVTPEFSLTGGLRFTHDNTGSNGFLLLATDPPVELVPRTSGREKTDKVTFRAAADYRFTPDILGFASFSRGYKSLAFNLLPYSPLPNEPEVIDAYEVGLKTDLLDRRLRFNASAFWYDIDSPQVQLLQASAVILSNAESARAYGVDVDIQAVPIENLTIRLSGSYLKSKYTGYEGAPSAPPIFVPPFGATSPVLEVSADNNKTSRAPEFSGNIGFDYLVDVGTGNVRFTADYYYTDDFFYEPDNILRQEGYGLLSGQIRYSPNEQVSLAVWGKNLTDKQYTNFASTQSGPGGFPYGTGAPRTYGATFGFNF